jgi:ubiquinone/menaquinone biosynthesis C-methylase UbiE
MVALAHRRLPAATERLVEGVIESLPFTDASFDAVAVTGVLEHSEIERALRELARVLRPGGKAVFSYPNPNGLYDIWKTRGWYRFVRTAKRLARRPPLVARGRSRALQPHRFQELLRAAGLEPERVEYTGLAVMPAPLDAVFHRTTDRLARRFEGSGPGLRRRLADQVLYVARKTDTTETPAS